MNKPRINSTFHFLSILVIVTLAFNVPLSITSATASDKNITKSELMKDEVTPPVIDNSVMFIENVGQFDKKARFQVRGGNGTIWLAEDGVWITLLEKLAETNKEEVISVHDLSEIDAQEENIPSKGVNIKLSFDEANPHPAMEPFNRLETSVNYFISNDPDNWHADVPVWGGVRYKDLYPGIDLEIKGENGQAVQQLIVREGADLSTVKLNVDGANELIIEGERLLIKTPLGDYALPLLQVTGSDTGSLPNARISINQILTPFSISENTPENDLYNSDISDLLYSTFLGEFSNTNYWQSRYCDIAVSENSEAYIVGNTYSSNFPTTPGAYDDSLNGSDDVFVVKLNAAGSALAYASFLGGGEGESSAVIAIDEGGSAYVTGYTTSTDFPVTAGAYDVHHNGNTDVFVTKLSPSGSTLAYSTFLGGSYDDEAKDITVGEDGLAYVTGKTYSTDFPITPGAYDDSNNGGNDVFVVKLNASGSELAYATYLGGGGAEYSAGIAIDEGGSAYVTGFTASTDFPVTAGAYDVHHNGRNDVFIVKLNPAGSAMTYATFIGGVDIDNAESIVIDNSGAAYVTGYTASGDFPTTPGAYDDSINGGDDVFVVKLNASGSELAYATYLGGGSLEHGYDIDINNTGEVYITGDTFSPDFPTTPEAYDNQQNGWYDVFVAKLNTAGVLVYSTFMGGYIKDRGDGIATDNMGTVYVTGISESPDFPTTLGAYKTNHSDILTDFFVSKLAMGVTQPPVTISHIEVNQALGVQKDGEQNYVAGKSTVIRVFLHAKVNVDPSVQHLVVSRADVLNPTILFPNRYPGKTDVLEYFCPESDPVCGSWPQDNYSVKAFVGDQNLEKNVIFFETEKLRILAVPVKINNGGTIMSLPDDQWKTAWLFMRNVYPVAQDGIEWEIAPEIDASDIDLAILGGRAKLWARVNNLQPLLCGKLGRPDCYDQIVGFIPAIALRCTDQCSICGCCEGFTYSVPLTNTTIVMANGSYIRDCPGNEVRNITTMRAVVAHEIGHTYGLGDEYNHPLANFRCLINPPPPEYDGTFYGNIFNPPACDNSDSCTLSDEIPWTGDGSGSLISSELVHPYEINSSVPSKSPRGLLGDSVSFMGNYSNLEDVWVTQKIYSHLFSEFVSQTSSIAVASLEIGEVLHASGWIGSDDSIVLEPWYSTSTTIPETSTGSYSIIAVDNDDQVIASQGFDLEFYQLSDPPSEINISPFSIDIPFPEGTIEFRIMHGTITLGTIPVSHTAPIVTIVSPNGGEVWNENSNYEISWIGTDYDGENLSYTLEYSPDGSNWFVLASNLTNNSFLVNTQQLPGGSNALIRVIVTDGVNTSEDISDNVFSITKKQPEANIIYPLNGELLPFNKTIIFDGNGYDLEDGMIFGENVSWSSNTDGPLGSGSQLLVDLSVGHHTITMQVEDSDANVATTEIEIDIVPCYSLSIAHDGNGSDPVADPESSTICPAGMYLEGEEIALSGAIADPGWNISGWLGTDNDLSTESTNTLLMPGYDHEVVVNYEEESPEFSFSPLLNEKLIASKVTFTWDAIPDAVKYKLQLSTKPDFSVLLLNIKTTEPTYFFDSFLKYSKTYYWRIKPIYVDSKGDWLPTWQFISMDPLVKPTLVSPGHKEILTISDATLEWTPVENAVLYKVVIAKDALFINQVTKLKTEDTTAVFNLTDGKYYWRVKAFDFYGAKSPWSDYRIFKVDVP